MKSQELNLENAQVQNLNKEEITEIKDQSKHVELTKLVTEKFEELLQANNSSDNNTKETNLSNEINSFTFNQNIDWERKQTLLDSCCFNDEKY